MKRIIIAIMLIGISGKAYCGPEYVKDVPGVLDFFNIASEEANSPRIVDYDETWLITGPVSDLSGEATKGENWKLVEGKVVYAYYRFNPGISALQIQREFEAKAKEEGFTIAFSCATEKGTCFTNGRSEPGVSLGLLLDKPGNMPALDKNNMSIVRNYFQTGGARYTYLTREDGGINTVHVAVSLADTPAKGVMAITKSIITGDAPSITGASLLASELKKNKSVSLNNLLFDVNSDILLPNSRDQIHEIAMMMREDASIKLEIVGHTDSDGGRDYNLDLSRRRAASVVRALVEDFDMERSRLTSSGKGLGEPIASNDTEDGKSQNRRVELKLR
ncbi:MULTISPECIES: OmpA family protein [Brucella/Ochrobactrum group]|uniref:OmpA family protein n=1 Tax=Brucella anthropi TaxID=529 RepID=A0A6L3Z0U7_BRUAN|nr:MULTISPECIES: OmpA family protein [Brucella]KAB2764304.1 OmpA family protein [Brucella anthropi]MCI1002657.1 OmpA family protein [Ochrobactrum sp. C6C9]